MSVKQHSLKFTKFSKYAPFIATDPKDRMSKFISCIFYLVTKECKMVMLVKDMDISCLRLTWSKYKRRSYERGQGSPKRLELMVGATLTKGVVVISFKIAKDKVAKEHQCSSSPDH